MTAWLQTLLHTRVASSQPPGGRSTRLRKYNGKHAHEAADSKFHLHKYYFSANYCDIWTVRLSSGQNILFDVTGNHFTFESTSTGLPLPSHRCGINCLNFRWEWVTKTTKPYNLDRLGPGRQSNSVPHKHKAYALRLIYITAQFGEMFYVNPCEDQGNTLGRRDCRAAAPSPNRKTQIL